LEFADPDDYDAIEADDVLRFEGLRGALPDVHELTVRNTTQDREIRVTHRLSPRQVEMVLAGGQIPLLARQEHPSSP
jgi:aconitate hydratase